jgi:lipopolysaccharide export LptBFGC system permease protein LptF
MFSALGKAAVLTPFVAAWTPLAVFVGLSTFFLFRFEK